MRKYNILGAPFGFAAGEQGSSLAPSDKLIGADIVEFSPENDVLKNTNQLVIRIIDAILGYRI